MTASTNKTGENDHELHARGPADTGTSTDTAGESQLRGIQSLMQLMGPQALTQVHALLTQLQSQNQQAQVPLPLIQSGVPAETALTPEAINDQLIARITGQHQVAIDAFAHDRGQLAYNTAMAEGLTSEEAENSGKTAREEARLFIIRSIAAAEANPVNPQV